MIELIEEALQDASDGLKALQGNAGTLCNIANAAGVIAQSLKAGGRVMSCGNGGSLCDAMHFAEELSGRFRQDRKPLAAMAIADAAHLTCVANDLGFDQVFSRYVEAHGRTGDVLVAISTSGKSPNILKAVDSAHAQGMQVIALTGVPHSDLAKVANISIATPAGKFSDRIQELHIKVIHIVIELIERAIFPENYPSPK